MEQIPIVVVAYNRPHCLQRILNSLSRASVPEQTPLIISLDRSDNEEMATLAHGHEWPHGPKQVICHKEHLGLKEHVLRCGDLAIEHGGVVVLEEDLYVSPHFYGFAEQALSRYAGDASIAGISLYSQTMSETACLAFLPLVDNSDMFFAQVPSSWGQCWSKSQWLLFRQWLKKKTGAKPTVYLPPDVSRWPTTTSWKKLFAEYLIASDRYFVYPRVSLSTNFGDAGTHMLKQRYDFQVPLETQPKDYRFASLDASACIYDSFWELKPAALGKLKPEFADLSFELDIYGQKDLDRLSCDFIFTTKECSSSLKGYELALKPPVLNMLADLEGTAIKLARRGCIRNQRVIPSFAHLAYYNSVHAVHASHFLRPHGQLMRKLPRLLSRLYSFSLKSLSGS